MSHDKLSIHALHVLKPPAKKLKYGTNDEIFRFSNLIRTITGHHVDSIHMKFRATLVRPSNAIGILIKNGSNGAHRTVLIKAFNEVQIKLANCVGCPHRLGSLRSAPHIPALYSRTLKIGLTLHRDQYTHEYS